jgi:signal transduction histidine kinase
MDRKPVDLVALLEEVLNQLGPMAREKSVNLVLGEIEPMEVPGDLVHLRRLLLNLVDNAVKYSRPGGEVKVSIGRTDEWAELIVADTGTGIPADERQKIFQRFYRSPEARGSSQGGSGLGLAIVKSIAEAHGGKVELESEPGKGSAFKIRLPLNPRAQE